MENSLGIMLDMARNGVMKVEKIKEFATIMKQMRYTTLYLYLEDVFEIDGEPKFGQLRGRYTKQELKDIDDFCYRLGIEVIPCIQTLAHLERLFQNANYAEIRDIDNILLIDSAKTYELIEKMVATMRQCFRSSRINIGMDEAFNVGHGVYLNQHGQVNHFELMNKHLRKVLPITEKYGFEAMMWSDMFFAPITGWYYVDKFDGKTKSKFEEMKRFVPENVALCYWDYFSVKIKGYEENVKAHKFLSKHIVFAGGLWSWACPAPQNRESIAKTKSALKAMEKQQIKDVMFTLWGDNGTECSYFSLLPSMLYAAEAYYGNYNMQSVKEKFFSLFGIEWDSFIKLDLVGSLKGDNGKIRACKYAFYNDPFCGKMDSFIEPDLKNQFKSISRKLKNASKTVGEYKYLFDYLYSLSKVLELKYTLSIDTQNAYAKKDFEALKKIAYSVYPQIIKRLDTFYSCARIRWNKENKPQGFEVQDIRIGGLRQRLIDCMRTLREYLNGTVVSIPELAQNRIDKNSRIEHYADIVTVNTL